jgi:hypothetical protein
MDAVKAKEKEMKDEKETERQVSDYEVVVALCGLWLTFDTEEDTGSQGQAGYEGGESSI